MIRSFSYEVVTRATPKTAWEIFTNWRRWQTFSNAYGSLAWVQGEPWTVGSRLRIEILRPIYVIVDHVITVHEPFRRVGWIDHVMGAVLEQWVTFEALGSGETSVKVYVNIVGGDTVNIQGKDGERLVREFTEEWYSNFRVVCDELSPGAVNHGA